MGDDDNDDDGDNRDNDDDDADDGKSDNCAVLRVMVKRRVSRKAMILMVECFLL